MADLAKRRIMREFKISEISGVNSPAQKGAVVALMKRNFSDRERGNLADEGKALPDGSFPIVTEADLHNAISAYGRAKDPEKAKAHIITRAKSLGCEGAIPEDWKTTKGEPAMADNSTKKALGLPETATDLDVTKAVEKLNADHAALKARQESLMKMSDKHTAFMNNPKAKMPSGGKGGFQAMEPGERDAHMQANPIFGGDDPDSDDAKKFAAAVAKAAASDEVLKVGDLEIRKSAVGDANFAIFKAQQQEIAKERDAREILEFTKMAETLYPTLPGEPIAKAQALRAMQKLGENERKALETMLKSGNDARKATFREIGGSGGNGADMPDDKLDVLAKTHATKAGISFEKAYDAVLKTPEGAELYAASRSDRMVKGA
jgi:hypothetical protein